jgi:mitotic spindle assembly checkpoint protein MAD2
MEMIFFSLRSTCSTVLAKIFTHSIRIYTLLNFKKMVTATATKNTITLKGSTDTVSEFFQYALSSILYQRGVYPAENFEPQKKYGLTVMAVRDAKLCSYLQSVLRQFSGKFVIQVLHILALRLLKYST